MSETRGTAATFFAEALHTPGDSSYADEPNASRTGSLAWSHTMLQSIRKVALPAFGGAILELYAEPLGSGVWRHTSNLDGYSTLRVLIPRKTADNRQQTEKAAQALTRYFLLNKAECKNVHTLQVRGACERHFQTDLLRVCVSHLPNLCKLDLSQFYPFSVGVALVCRGAKNLHELWLNLAHGQHLNKKDLSTSLDFLTDDPGSTLQHVEIFAHDNTNLSMAHLHKLARLPYLEKLALREFPETLQVMVWRGWALADSYNPRTQRFDSVYSWTRRVDRVTGRSYQTVLLCKLEPNHTPGGLYVYLSERGAAFRAMNKGSLAGDRTWVPGKHPQAGTNEREGLWGYTDHAHALTESAAEVATAQGS